MKYLAVVGISNNPKNNLEADIQTLLKSMNGTLISDISTFKADLNTHIRDLNTKHPRCKPANADWMDPADYPNMYPVIREQIEGTNSHKYGICRVCGCTDLDCSNCIARTGQPCYWVDEGHTICSACNNEIN